MLQITSIKPWNSTSFTGTRLILSGVTKSTAEVKALTLQHGTVCDALPHGEDQMEVLLVDNDPSESEKTVDDLIRALKH